MKVGDLIRIKASKPADGQDSISKFVGKTYEVKEVHFSDGDYRRTWDGRVSVYEEMFGGNIILQPAEFEMFND